MRSYVFDASPLLAFLQNKTGATRVSQLLNEAIEGRCEIFISAANYGEVYSGVLRTHGQDRARAVTSAVHPLPINVADATRQRALAAAEVKVKYKRYFSDSFAAALAIDQKAALVTSDSDFRRVGHSIPIVWLKA